jgi:hypothetical protein
MLLRVPLDEVEPCQVDIGKWLGFYPPFKLGICKSQMEDFQPVLHLVISTSKIKKKKKTKVPHGETSILDTSKRK